MAYSTQSDLVEQISSASLIELTDDAGAGTVDESVVTRAIADADALIDSYCGKRYTVPFSTVPAIVRKMSVDIAIYNLYARPVHMDETPASRRDRYRDAVDILKAIARGDISLGASDPDGSPPETSAPEFHSDNPERVFSRSKLSGF
jgi:phage gp36-like protein